MGECKNAFAFERRKDYLLTVLSLMASRLSPRVSALDAWATASSTADFTPTQSQLKKER